MAQLLSLLLLLVFPALVIAGGLKDFTSFTIPNWLSVSLALAFLPAALVSGLPMGQIGLSVGVGFVLLIAGMAMFAAGWIGGGDAKLFAAAGLWIGWPGAIEFVLYTTVAGGALAVLLMSARLSPLPAYAVRGPVWVNRLLEKGGPAPYGVAIAIGALIAFPESPFLNTLHGLGLIV
jgi:prepilin peptidase CpaA